MDATLEIATTGLPAMADLTGEYYASVLERLHTTLRPKAYLEIGVFTGLSLAKARCASIAIDPAFQILPDHLAPVFDKPAIHFYQMGSDDFFARFDPADILGMPLDLAFLDGMHRCEFLLRDFMNTERSCKPNSVIALHDCLPVDTGIVDRDPDAARVVEMAHRSGWWAGDVWRTSLLLRRRRPDLRMTVLDCSPTGLVLITNLDPSNDALRRGYAGHVDEMMAWDLKQIGLHSLFDEMGVLPASTLGSHEEITRRFWL